MVAATRWFGREIESPVPVDPKDRRFADPAWSTNPLFYGMRLAYLATLPVRPGRRRRRVAWTPTSARKAELALDLALDALAPTNFLALNPAALKRAFDTAGAQRGQGRAAPSSTTWSTTTAGRARSTPAASASAATSPRRRARSCSATSSWSCIQYAPQTEQVHARPLLCSPPWINKYYVMDLAPGPQLHRVGGAARPHGLRDQLPQPVQGHGRHDDGRLPAQRPADRAGRDPGDHRRRDRSTSSGCAWAAR